MWLFLALVHHRMGDEQEALRCRAFGTGRMSEQDDPSPELIAVRRETDTALGISE